MRYLLLRDMPGSAYNYERGGSGKESAAAATSACGISSPPTYLEAAPLRHNADEFDVYGPCTSARAGY